MTTNFLDNKICTFKILLSWRFPRKKKKKQPFWTIFLSAPNAPPPQKCRFYFCFRLAVSERRFGSFFEFSRFTNLEAQQRYFSYRAILVAIVSQNNLVLVFVGYRTSIARYVAKCGIAQMCLCETKYQGGVIAPFAGSANLPEKVSRDMGYRSDSIAISRDMGPLCLQTAFRFEPKIFRGCRSADVLPKSSTDAGIRSPGFSTKNRSPHALPGASDSPFPLPEQKK